MGRQTHNQKQVAGTAVPDNNHHQHMQAAAGAGCSMDRQMLEAGCSADQHEQGLGRCL